jgi:hypothetical protein
VKKLPKWQNPGTNQPMPRNLSQREKKNPFINEKFLKYIEEGQ